MKPANLTPLQEKRAIRLKMDMQSGDNANGFLSAIILALRYIYTTDVPTAAVNNQALYFNPDFMFSDDWSPEDRVFVAFHEALHIAYGHITQRGSRDPTLWNVAGDMRINTDLLNMGFKRPSKGVFDDKNKYTDWTTAQIYEDLIETGYQPDPSFGGMGVDMVEDDPDLDDSDTGNVDTRDFEDIIAAATAVANATEDGWGKLPGSLKSALQTEQSRKVSWKQHLAEIPQKVNRSGINYRKFSRRHIARGQYNPRREGKQLGTVAVAWDTSCSVTNQEIALMKGECEHLRDMLNPEKFEILCFDTEVHETHVIDQYDSIGDIEIQGRGGTDLHCIFDYFDKQSEQDISCLLVFSDMECQIVEKAPDYPVFWICIDNPAAQVKFGELIHYSVHD